MIRTLCAALLAAIVAAPAQAADAPVDRLRAVLARFDDHIRTFDVQLSGCQLDMVYFQELGSGDKRGKNWQIWRQDLAVLRLAEGAPEKGETTWRFIAPRRAGDARLAEQTARFAALAFDADHMVNRIAWADIALESPDLTVDYRRFSYAPLNWLRLGDAAQFEAPVDPARNGPVFDALRGAAAPFSVKLEAEWRTKSGAAYDGPGVMYGEVAPPLRSPILNQQEAEAFGAALRDHAAAHCPDALR